MRLLNASTLIGIALLASAYALADSALGGIILVLIALGVFLTIAGLMFAHAQAW